MGKRFVEWSEEQIRERPGSRSGLYDAPNRHQFEVHIACSDCEQGFDWEVVDETGGVSLSQYVYPTFDQALCAALDFCDELDKRVQSHQH